MKIYLEITELLSEADSLILQPLSMRVEVIDRDDALAKLLILEPFFAGRIYKKQLHFCGHAEGLPCTTEEVL
ncbi:MAG: hypothetical protein Q8J64_06590 [Thermodesulfovibrionales bacterium]|nr:hypothetical protein [Thermodesulfovibrionales bacterium]